MLPVGTSIQGEQGPWGLLGQLPALGTDGDTQNGPPSGGAVTVHPTLPALVDTQAWPLGSAALLVPAGCWGCGCACTEMKQPKLSLCRGETEAQSSRDCVLVGVGQEPRPVLRPSQQPSPTACPSDPSTPRVRDGQICADGEQIRGAWFPSRKMTMSPVDSGGPKLWRAAGLCEGCIPSVTCEGLFNKTFFKKAAGMRSLTRALR